MPSNPPPTLSVLETVLYFADEDRTQRFYSEVMKWPGTLLEPSMSTATVDRILSEERHHGLPVVENGRLIGLLTREQLLRIVRNQMMLGGEH